MSIRSMFVEPPQLLHPLFRYGMLFIILALLALHVRWYLNLPSTYVGPRHFNSVVLLLLLFNHLAFQFRWPSSISIIFRILALIWIMLCYVYIVWFFLTI
jgi:hypothetical protein